MDAIAAIEAHRTALLRLTLTLFALVGFSPDGKPVSRLPKSVRLQALRTLRPVGSATRRLIYWLSKRLPVDGAPKRNIAKTRKGKVRVKGVSRAPVFNLFDRRKYFPELANPRKRVRRGPRPRIWLLDGFDHLRHPAKPEKPVRDPDDATRVCRQIQALHRALSDLPREARRLRRAMERRLKNPPGPGRYGPLREGWPPGYRVHARDEVQQLLYECNLMAQHDPPGDRTGW